MKKWIWAVTIVFLAAPLVLTARAQDRAANPVSAVARQILDRYSTILISTAEEMPADKYSYHPTPEQLSFGRVIEHIAESNFTLCSAISSTPAPQGPKVKETDPKDALVAAVKASFDYCTQALANLQDSQMGDSIALFGGRQASRATAVFALSDDLYDHYAALAIYLRLNGMLPPTAQPKK